MQPDTTIHRFRRGRIIWRRTGNVGIMQAHPRNPAQPVVITTDSELQDHVLAVAAVAGVEPRVVADASDLRTEWSNASMVVIGIDSAPWIGGLALARRTETYLVGGQRSRDELSRWSVQLGAAVVTLPDGATWLATAMAERGSVPGKRACLIALIGGAGGVGCSTLAAGLSLAAGRVGYRTLLLDCDALGGGIDLLVGAERVEGWRWPQLASVSGEIGDLAGQLPQVDGIDILSMARDSRSPVEMPRDPGRDQMESVLSWAGRSFDLIVADLPRALGDGPIEVLRRCRHVVLVAPATVRGIAASLRMGTDLLTLGPPPVVAVRRPPAARIAPEAVSSGLGFPVIGVIADEPSLRLGAERGDPPGRSVRSPMHRMCRELLDRLMPSQATAA